MGGYLNPKCELFSPEVVQCYNRGLDGIDANVRIFILVFKIKLKILFILTHLSGNVKRI